MLLAMWDLTSKIVFFIVPVNTNRRMLLLFLVDDVDDVDVIDVENKKM